MSHLCDPRVGALAVDAVVLQPLVLRVRAVLLQGAAVLPFAPDTPKQRVRLQTHAAAAALGVALVQMDCVERGEGGGRGRESGATIKPLHRHMNSF